MKQELLKKHGLLTLTEMQDCFEEGEGWQEKNEERNKFFLDLFEDELNEQGLSPKTIRKHLLNVETFLDELAFREGYTMEESIFDIGIFLGDWYIRRCMWSSASNIKTTATSIKKFAKAMLEYDLIDEKSYLWMLSQIKKEMPEWQRRCAYYDDPDQEFDFNEFYGW